MIEVGTLCQRHYELRLEREGDEGDFVLKEDPLRGRVECNIRTAPAQS
jgi:hypothetical protein